MTVQDQVVTAAKPVTLVSFGKAHVPHTLKAGHSPHLTSGFQNTNMHSSWQGTPPPYRPTPPLPYNCAYTYCITLQMWMER
jgi:hypothetical protein